MQLQRPAASRAVLNTGASDGVAVVSSRKPPLLPPPRLRYSGASGALTSLPQWQSNSICSLRKTVVSDVASTQSLLTWSRTLLVDNLVVFRKRKHAMRVVEGAVLAVDCHWRVWRGLRFELLDRGDFVQHEVSVEWSQCRMTSIRPWVQHRTA